MSQKKWHAVYTRPKWEKKVASLLARRNVEAYCPMNRVARQWADRKKILYQPLFPSYVFVRMESAEELTVKQTEGILNFVYWLGKPAIIRNEEIEAIERFLHNHEDVTLEKIQVNISDKIRIIDGPLLLMEGSILEVKSQTVKVLLPSLGCAMTAEVRKSSIEIIQQAKYITRAS